MTKIEWADEVWNPTSGCTPVSEGCRNCNAAPALIALAEWAEKAKATFNTLSNVSHSEQLVVEICEKALAAKPTEGGTQ